jgi:hypothetical protein
MRLSTLPKRGGEHPQNNRKINFINLKGFRGFSQAWLVAKRLSFMVEQTIEKGKEVAITNGNGFRVGFDSKNVKGS